MRLKTKRGKNRLGTLPRCPYESNDSIISPAKWTMPLSSRARSPKKTQSNSLYPDLGDSLKKYSYDEDKDSRGPRFLRGLRQRPMGTIGTMLTSDTPSTRSAVLVMVIMNLMICYFVAYRMVSDDPLSSFAAWAKHTRIALPKNYQCPDVANHPPRRDRFPSIEKRVRLYMGRWYEPKLQGVPPASPFGMYWRERYEALERESKLSRWDLVRIPHEPIVNPLDMDPIKLYKCSARKLSTNDYALATACIDTNAHHGPQMVQRNMKDLIPAALLIQERLNLSWLSSLMGVLRYEGVLGLITELQRCWTPSAPAAYLWHFGQGVTKATTQWNTLTPVFGRVRDLLAENDEDLTIPEQPQHRSERIPLREECPCCGSRHSTILWPLEREIHRTAASQVPESDREFDSKKSKLFWRGSAYPGLDVPILGKLAPELSGYQQRFVEDTRISRITSSY